jgi:hypothetical protein
MVNYWFCSESKEISLNILVTIKRHCIYYGPSSVTTFTSFSILWFCKHTNRYEYKRKYFCNAIYYLLAHIRLDVSVSRTQTVVNHTIRETRAIIMHTASHTVHITFHVLHNGEWTEIFKTLHSCKQYNTHSPHFTFQAIFLNTLLLMQTEQLCDCIQYLTKHMIKKAWVKIVDSILHHQKWISKMRFTCLLYTPWHIFYTFPSKIWHITWRMLSITSSFLPCTPSSYDHISLMQTLNVH